MGGEAHPIPNPSNNITTASSGTGGVTGSPSAAAVVGGSPLSASAAKVKVKALALAVMKEDVVVGMEVESEAEAEAETESLTPTPTAMPALKKGPWTSAEDAILVEYVKKHGEGNWNAVQKYSGLYRCGKSCRLRWANHLRPNLKKGAFTAEEERLILELHAKLGNKWARMAAQLPGRTDNEIKNYWNTRIKRRQRAGLPLYPPDIQQQLHSSSSSASPSAAHVHHQQRPHTHTQVNVAADIFSSSSVSVSAASVSSLSFKADGNGGVGVGLSPRVTFESLNSCPAPLLPPSMCNVASMAVGGSLCLPVPVPLPLHATTYGTSTGGGMKALCDSNFLKPLQASASASASLPYPLQETFSSAATATPPMVGLSPPPDFMVTAHLPLPLALQEDFMNIAKPFTGLVKMELPSIQVAESVHHMPGSSMSMSVITGNNPHARANANPNPDVHVDHLGLLSNNNNSGLLESLLQEAHFMGAGNTTTVKIPAMSCSPASSCSEFQGASSCSSSNHTDNVISSLQSKVSGNFRASDPLASLEGHPSFSILNDNTAVPTMGTRTSLVDDTTTSHSGIERKVKVEEATEEYMSSASCDDEHFSVIMGFGRHESFPDTDWYNQNSEMAKEQSVVSENIASLLNDDLGTTVQLPVTTTSDHSWGLCSCPWSNMPGVC